MVFWTPVSGGRKCICVNNDPPYYDSLSSTKVRERVDVFGRRESFTAPSPRSAYTCASRPTRTRAGLSICGSGLTRCVRSVSVVYVQATTVMSPMSHVPCPMSYSLQRFAITDGRGCGMCAEGACLYEEDKMVLCDNHWCRKTGGSLCPHHRQDASAAFTCCETCRLAVAWEAGRPGSFTSLSRPPPQPPPASDLLPPSRTGDAPDASDASDAPSAPVVDDGSEGAPMASDEDTSGGHKRKTGDVDVEVGLSEEVG